MISSVTGSPSSSSAGAKPAKRTFAYRDGKRVEITGQNMKLGPARYPFIKISEKLWNRPK